MSSTHHLKLPQPWAWALIAGEIEVANCDYPPAPSLIGQRLGIVGGERWESWWLLEGLGIALRKDAAGGLAQECQAPIWMGTAELVGYLLVEPGRKVTQQVRPGSETPFRARKGVLGPVSWVFRRPKLGGAVGGTRWIRAFWEDSKHYREQLLCYAEQHGADGLSAWHRDTLAKLGYLRPEKVDT